MRNYKKLATIGSVAFLFLLIATYSLYRTKDLITGVILRTDSIKNGETLNNSLLEIHGSAKNAVNLTLNDREISVDKNWNFKESLILLPGWNIIELKARDKFGGQKNLNYQVIFTPTQDQNPALEQ